MYCDKFCRPINYLRISVTDRCNLRCIYCVPATGIPLHNRNEILTYEEIVRLSRLATRLGITKIRLTGGEPLTRRGLVDLVRMLALLPLLDDLSLTTNGTLLARTAAALAEAGLCRVNISLDTMRPDRFSTLTRGGALKQVLTGIERAQEAGLTPVKINMVVMRAINDDEIDDFARRTITDGWHVRFIEIMPIGKETPWLTSRYVSTEEVRCRIEERLGLLQPVLLDDGGPARYWQIPEAQGTIGFISPISDYFCLDCNRLRMTADGRLLPCLFSDHEIELLPLLRQGGNDEQLQARFVQAITAKPPGHQLDKQITPCRRLMSRTGG
ncbi:GTP 3',8-cyclase MoaA [Candidatus Acetothermia bacterium]|jgi:cyclic pyranopterin phosphate synthase|nr:GTP 3',8-cyclase MoaA [Candidatus Acetothermia bacterium]MCI2427472.1 GTP 3',8-cyclase MoaA [Candidatus Acetothermia bacterium]